MAAASLSTLWGRRFLNLLGQELQLISHYVLAVDGTGFQLALDPFGNGEIQEEGVGDGPP